MSTFTCQDETSLQAPVVIDIGVTRCLYNDIRCVVFVTHECTKWEHLDMETDPTDGNKTTFFRLLFLHGISVPSQIIFQPLVDAIFVNDAKVSQSIIGEIEYLELTIMCPHEVVCHDGDETLVVLAQAIQDVLLRYLIEIVCLVHHHIYWFHFLFTLSIR